ncbi:DMT family transporter [Gryllotalpicola daejeonensis]|uniref:DMT family transporter n=1 Tax=Gryllotalpicola daejeonensis TaxID=993087 RepID=A0ABP7ZM54_9MICO
MIVAVALALACGMSYGVSDFFGGVSSARVRVAPTSFLTYGLATVVAAAALLVAGGRWSGSALAWAVLAGLFAVSGTLAFYAALVAGPMSLVTPIVGTIESAVPVIAAVLIGQRMTALTWLAIVLAIAGGALVSLKIGAGERLTARPALLAVAGGLLFGGSIIALNRAPRDSGLIPAVFEGGVGFVIMAALLAWARASTRVSRLLRLFDGGADAAPAAAAPGRSGIRSYAAGIASGVLLGASNTLLVLALRAGPLAVVSVLADLYPVAAVLLAWLVLRERLSAVQVSGVALAVGASALFALA